MTDMNINADNLDQNKKNTGEPLNGPGKKVLITGASRGIGEAVAKCLAANGYDLMLTCSESFDRLSDIAKELEEKYNIRCIGKRADSGDHEAVRSVFEDPFFNEGLDVLVNNAGISYVGLLHEMSVDDWHRIVSVNLDGVFYFCKYAIPAMLKNRTGRIVNISSVWGEVGASTEVAYSATKGGVNAFTRALAKELAPNGITVNAVSCGLIDTQMNACFSAEDLKGVIKEIPADRMGKPEEIARAVHNLVSMPDYMTGQVIRVDGGWI